MGINTNLIDIKINDTELFNGEEVNLPSILSKQFRKLKLLDNKVKKAEDDAKKAHCLANEAKEKVTFWKGRKTAIEELQVALKAMSKAIISNTESNKVLFELQKELSNFSKSVLALGIVNITQNRIIVRELELRLQGATDEELGEFAKEELKAVVKQLRAQQDIQIKLDKSEKNILEIKNEIRNTQNITKKNEKLIESIKNKFSLSKVIITLTITLLITNLFLICFYFLK